MAPNRKVSHRQMEILLDFIEKHRELAAGRHPGGPLGVQAARQLWEDVAAELNAIGTGVSKTGQKWRRYWIEFKNGTKTKAADHRRMAQGTGGGPNKLQPLNEYEQRALSIIGRVAVEGLQGVRLPIPGSFAQEESLQAYAQEVQEPVASCSTQEDPWSIPQEPIDLEITEENQYNIQEPYMVEVLPDAVPNENAGNSSTRTSSRPRHAHVPAWAYEMEQSRLRTEQDMVNNVGRLVTALDNIAKILVERLMKIEDAVTKLGNK